jgi:hypothetical protein
MVTIAPEANERGMVEGRRVIEVKASKNSADVRHVTSTNEGKVRAQECRNRITM